MEIFNIDEVQRTYYIQVERCRNVPIARAVYEYQLLEVKYPDMYLVERIVKKRGNQLHVKWLGFIVLGIHGLIMMEATFYPSVIKFYQLYISCSTLI